MISLHASGPNCDLGKERTEFSVLVSVQTLILYELSKEYGII